MSQSFCLFKESDKFFKLFGSFGYTSQMGGYFFGGSRLLFADGTGGFDGVEYVVYGIIHFGQRGLDFLGSFPGLFSQFADFLSNYGKATPLFARAGGLNRCIQAEKIGLPGDIGNKVNNLECIAVAVFEQPCLLNGLLAGTGQFAGA